MKKFSQGSHVSFEILYGRYKDAIFRFVMKSLLDASSAEDVCHESWLAVIDNAERFHAQAGIKNPFKQWLYRIAHNKLIDHWRRANKYSELQAEPSLAEEGLGEADTLEQYLRWNEVSKFLAQLPTVQQQCYLLQLEGFSLAEIAKISGSEVETVKSRLRYAKKKLQQMVELEQ